MGHASARNPEIIAHRGASGYAVEHSEAAVVLAHAQHADWIEQDVVLSKDSVFLVSHDTTMETTTNVEEVFPERARSDGHWYFADFSWSELQSRCLHERTRKGSAADRSFPNRFPGSCGQRLMRLEDELLLIRGLDQTLGRTTGLYIELKAPAFHHTEFGKHMGESLLELLSQHGIEDASHHCILQCFEANELKFLERNGCRLPLVQLLGSELRLDDVEKIAEYADGIGPSLDALMARNDSGWESSGLVEKARSAGLFVHPYTVRREILPPWATSFQHLHEVLARELDVDAFFTDFPDLSRTEIQSLRLASPHR